MRNVWLAAPMLALLGGAMPPASASDSRIGDLALCRESWLELKDSDPAALDSFGALLRSDFIYDENAGSMTPRSPVTVDGLTVTQVFPGSLGMGVGFSVLVAAPFDTARQAVERDLGKPLEHCDFTEGTHTCELSIAERRTVLLASADPPNDQSTLIGCFYLYEK